MSATAARRAGAVAATLALAGWAAPAAGQRVSPYRASSAVVPQTVTVGDVFQAAVRIVVPAGATVAFADSLAAPADVEAAGRRTVQVDTTADGRLSFTASYPLTAWRPADVSLPATRIVVRPPPADGRAAGSDDTLSVTFPSFAIQTVLPGDTAGIEPKQAKDVLGRDRLWWPILVAGILALALLAALYAWYRRRRPHVQVEAVPLVPPRERALAALEAARASGLVEQGRSKEFYTAVTDAVRAYVEALDGRWGRDLTTSELAGRMRGQGVDATALSLSALLGGADLVKFAQRRPAPAEAYAEWSAARRFVESFDWPPPAVLPSAAQRAA